MSPEQQQIVVFFGAVAVVVIVLVSIGAVVMLGAAALWASSNHVLNDPAAARELLDRQDPARRTEGRAQASSPRVRDVRRSPVSGS